MLVIVSVVVAEEVPEIVALAAWQVGAESEELDPVMEQVRLTVPVNPLKGVTVMVAAAEDPGPEMVSVGGPEMPIFGVGTPLTVTPALFDVDPR